MSNDQLEMLLVEWEIARQKGEDLTAEQVLDQAEIVDKAEMLDQLRQRIEALKATSWMLQDASNASRSDVALADTNELAGGSTNQPQAKKSYLRPTTTEQFLDAIVSSDVLDDKQVGWLKQLVAKYDPDITPREMADRLIEEDLLTSYQASVLLSGKPSPLVLDRYIILDTLGAGGMGVVYKALHRAMERVVAIKVLPKHALDSPYKVRRFQREIKATARLKHPHIVVAYDAHQSEGNCFLVMEHVEGDDLKKTVLMHGPLEVSDAVTIVVQIASALAAAHSLDIVHRDVKPSNILLSEDGVPKLLDLGLARAKEVTRQESTNQLTREGLAMGTAAYMAPEQARNPRNADIRSDIYSLGCTLYFLIVGKPMFNKDSSLETILAHMEEQPPSLQEHCQGVSDELEKVYQRMIAKQPADRYANMTEVRAALMATGLVDPEQVVESAKFKLPPAENVFPRFAGGALLGIAAALLIAFGAYFVSTQIRSKGDQQRDYASWVINSRGTVTAKTSLGEQSFSSTAELPIKSFQVVGLDLKQSHLRVPLDAVFTNQELEQLSLQRFTPEQLLLPKIVQLEKLSTLRLIECGLRDEHIQELVSLDQLKLLDLSGNEDLTDAALEHIGHLTQLEELDLSGIAVSDFGLTLLADLENLQRLVLVDTEVTPTGIAQFTAAHPECQIILAADHDKKPL